VGTDGGRRVAADAAELAEPAELAAALAEDAAAAALAEDAAAAALVAAATLVAAAAAAVVTAAIAVTEEAASRTEFGDAVNAGAIVVVDAAT